MNTTATASLFAGVSRFKVYLALSRTPHGLLDLCTPLVVALLWLGHLPTKSTTAFGLLAAFAGYTAVYALNDLVDYRTDRDKVLKAGFHREDNYLDAVFIRHPLAQGLLSVPEAASWAGFWTLVSLIAAYRLNPVCALILVAGCILETIYCLLLRVSQLRTLVSGMVKTLGGLAAVFAVDPAPDPGLLPLMFFWLFFWEIGGQNIPADWHDIEEDAALAAKTIPVLFGPRGASRIVSITLTISAVLGALFLYLAPLRLSLSFFAAALTASLVLLLIPAYYLFRKPDRDQAAILFNRASYYPLSLLVIVTMAMVLAR